MKLPLLFTLATILVGSSLVPTTAEAARDSGRYEMSHGYREAEFRPSHHYRHSRLVQVWVRGHVAWWHGHRHWVPGHYEWRRIYYWR